MYTKYIPTDLIQHLDLIFTKLNCLYKRECRSFAEAFSYRTNWLYTQLIHHHVKKNVFAVTMFAKIINIIIDIELINLISDHSTQLTLKQLLGTVIQFIDNVSIFNH